MEIESSSEVDSHPEHVRYNMIKWRRLGFEQCHTWSTSPKVRPIFESLSDEERKGVRVQVI